MRPVGTSPSSERERKSQIFASGRASCPRPRPSSTFLTFGFSIPSFGPVVVVAWAVCALEVDEEATRRIAEVDLDGVEVSCTPLLMRIASSADALDHVRTRLARAADHVELSEEGVVVDVRCPLPPIGPSTPISLPATSCRKLPSSTMPFPVVSEIEFSSIEVRFARSSDDRIVAARACGLPADRECSRRPWPVIASIEIRLALIPRVLRSGCARPSTVLEGSDSRSTAQWSGP